VAIVPIRLDVEVDGPHHLFSEQRLKDEERDRKLRRVAWEVERFPVELVRERPQVFKARVRAAAEARLALLDHA
jgi:very-short-patch-repair endonuclease